MAQLVINDGKAIHVRNDAGNAWQEIQNLYVRNDASTDWKFIQRSWARDDAGEEWRLVWDPMIVFTHSGEVQTFTVPYACDKLYCRIWGGGGGLAAHVGGYGGYTEVDLDLSDLSISGGDTLQIVVGGGHRLGTPAQYSGAINDAKAPYLVYGGGGAWSATENPNAAGYAGGGMSGIFKSGAGLLKWHWPNIWKVGRGTAHGGSYVFYTNPNASTSHAVDQTGPGNDALAGTMVTNVLAVAGGGGGGGDGDNGGKPGGDGGGNVGESVSTDQYAAGGSQTSGGNCVHAPNTTGMQWWGGCGGDHHNAHGGGGGWFGGGQVEYVAAGGSGYLKPISGVSGNLRDFGKIYHYGGSYWNSNSTLEPPPTVATVGYNYGKNHGNVDANSSAAAHGLVTIRFRPYNDNVGNVGDI